MILTLLHVLAALLVTVHAALHKRNVRSAAGWIGLAWFAPLVGPALYPLLGINRIRRAAAARGMGAWNARLSREPQEQEHLAGELPHSGFIGMNRLALRISGRPLTAGNRVEPLENGDAAYPAMLRAIGSAEKSVTLCSYIFDHDEAGLAFLEALGAAAARGVQVRVLVDALGARYSRRSMVEALRRAGVRAEAFLPPRWRRLFRYANLRNHRKILVVDGKTGFTGGMNIRFGHLVGRRPPYPIRCLHFRVSGPVVADLQHAFAADWALATGEILSGPEWHGPPEPAGAVYARGIPDGPDSDLDDMRNVMLGALTAAQYRIKIVTPYFLPDEALTAALKIAALRGVAVDIVLPGRSNIPVIDWATAPQLPALAAAGCRVHLTPPPFDHAKIFAVDGIWSLIGSTNWDPRSLRLNFEYNLECYDGDLAAALEHFADRRIEAATRFDPSGYAELPFPLRLRNGLTRLLTPYL